VFQWVANSTHNISAPSTQGTGGTQYLFSSWSDRQPQTHQIVASSSATYTASFITQYYLSMTATNGGAVTPSSGYYNSGQTVTVTAPSTASNGAIFTGFSGAISGMSLQQTMVLAGPEGVVANFTAVPSSVPITALPASETVAPGGTTTFSVVVNNAAGLGGAANLAISGVPQGSTASFSPASLGGPGTSTLSVAVASNTALGTYPLTITASNGTSTATTMATLTVTSPVPANMISPASGSSLSAGPVTFAWDSGLGVSQYQFVLGTQPGKSDLYNGAAGTSQSASFTLEASGPSAYGQLSSMVAGVWQPPIQYSYKLNQTSPQSVTASGIGYSNNADWVDAGGPASQPWTYCVVPAGSSCSNTTLSAAYISNCQVDAFVSAKILAEGYASSTEQPNAFDVTFTASASAPPGPRSLSCLYSPPSSAGLTLKLKNALTVDSAPPYIASIIQETQAYPGAPFYVYLYGKHFGSQPGWVNVCLRAGGIFIPPCQATTDLTVTPPYLVWSDNEVELELTPTTTTPGQYDLMVSAQFTADGASVEDDPTGQGSNRATVLVNQPLTISGTVTLGTSGKPIPGVSVTLADGNNKFLALTRSAANGTYSFSVSAGGTYEVRTSQIGYYFTPASSLYQNLAQSVTNANFVAKPLTTIYLIHGIGQGSAAMASLAANLTNPANGLDLTRFQVDAGFDFSQCAANPSCSNSCSIGAGGQSLAQYISSNPPPGPIILIGYSMGGLIARDMISNAFYGQSAPTVAGLITLGTPHLGYPFDPVDQLAFCPTLVFQMNGGWPAATQNEFLSAYLTSLIGSQSFKSTMASNGAYWMAAAGRHCSIPTRLTPSTNGNGCLVSSPRSDCIVCNDSALYTGSIPQSQNDITPIAPWTDTQKIYVHTNSVGGWGSSFIFGSTTPAVDQQLFDPLTTGTLFSAIVNFINGN
jgi:pimeloyl-ACP methyl ester carboxylesterase